MSNHGACNPTLEVRFESARGSGLAFDGERGAHSRMREPILVVEGGFEARMLRFDHMLRIITGCSALLHDHVPMSDDDGTLAPRLWLLPDECDALDQPLG